MKTGRNEPCPCGSGKKYKKCCQAAGHSTKAIPSPQASPREQLEAAKTALARGDLTRARQRIKTLLEQPRVAASTWLLACGIEMQAQNFDRARIYIEKAVELEPDNAAFLYNYATTLAQLGNQERAVDIFRRVLSIQPNLYQACFNLGNTLRDLGRSVEAVECYLKVFEADVRQLRILSQILLSMHHFTFDDHEKLYDMHISLGRKITDKALQSSPRRRPTRTTNADKIRLGYVSPRFSREIVGYFFKPLFDHHDRSRFEIFLYSATPRRDDMTDYLARDADKWSDIEQLSDTAFCQKIVDDQIDILIDLAGHAPENRLAAIARKPAPVQISMLDYFDTTGIEAMDYYVTDRFSTPPDGKQKFSEELIYLDQPRLVYEAPAYAPPVRLRSPEDAGIVFGSFNRHEKIIPEVVKTWSALLREVPDSRLVLKSTGFAQAEIQDSYRQKFSKLGIAPDRILFRGRTPHVEMLAEYGDIDIALDTFPYNGGLTTCEALWMGIPVIAMAGERIISRQSVGMLHSLGLAEFVATTTEEFTAIGKYWAGHREELNALRQSLRDKMAHSPLTDARRYTQDLERHLEQVWALYLSQQD